MLLAAIPSVTVLFIRLVPMAKDAQRAEFASEASAIALRVNFAIMQSLMAPGLVRNYVEDEVNGRRMCDSNAIVTNDALQRAAFPFIRCCCKEFSSLVRREYACALLSSSTLHRHTHFIKTRPFRTV